jgi:NTE family protein
MKECKAIVLSGGGALGALQVGALRALAEVGFQPDLLVGTSIGAINAVCLAAYGFNPQGIRRLEENWLEAANKGILPSWSLRHNLADWKVYFRGGYGGRIRDFFISHGISPNLTFGLLGNLKVILVASDLNSGEKVLFGTDPDQVVLEGMLASAAIPPWVYPLQVREYYLADGGFVSNLPVEAALEQGATRIITLELNSPPTRQIHGVRPFFSKVLNTVEKRQSDLELALAKAMGIPVFRIPLVADEKYTFWDFRSSGELIEIGYRLARQEITSSGDFTFVGFEKTEF